MAGQMSQSVAAGYVASYGRDQELQADALGAEYLARNTFDPRNMIDVIRVLKDQERFAADVAKAEGRSAPAQGDWLSSHPSNDQRLNAIIQLASQHKGNYTDEGRARYQRVIAGMAFGESADQGLSRGRNYFHAMLGFGVTAPAGWLIQNDADKLGLMSPAGDAALIIHLLPAKAGKDPAAIIRDLLKPASGQSQALSINGLQATRFLGTRQDAQGQSQTIAATVVRGPADNMYVLQALAKDAAALQRAQSALLEAEGSFRPLSAHDRAAARPWVLKTVAYPKGGFAELARNSPVERAEQQLRLINGFYSGGEPKPGQSVKVIEIH
jgi:predicted Zn-dependent protease